jgi:hypothetical protein
MSLNFCTKLAWKARRLGYERKASARVARCCQFLMAFACGLLGIYGIATPGIHGVPAGAVTGSSKSCTGLLFFEDVALRR